MSLILLLRQGKSYAYSGKMSIDEITASVEKAVEYFKSQATTPSSSVDKKEPERKQHPMEIWAHQFAAALQQQLGKK